MECRPDGCSKPGGLLRSHTGILRLRRFTPPPKRAIRGLVGIPASIPDRQGRSPAVPYGCFLPDLTRFGTWRRPGPSEILDHARMHVNIQYSLSAKTAFGGIARSDQKHIDSAWLRHLRTPPRPQRARRHQRLRTAGCATPRALARRAPAHSLALLPVLRRPAYGLPRRRLAFLQNALDAVERRRVRHEPKCLPAGSRSRPASQRR